MLTLDSIDLTGYQRSIGGLYDALAGSGKDASTVLLDEQPRLVRAIVNITPPVKSARWGSPKTSGEMAIRSELFSLFNEADPALINQVTKNGASGIDTWITDKNGQKQQLKWENVDATGSQMKALHNRYRNSRGKISKNYRQQEGTWRARVVVPKGMRAPYVKAEEGKVGRARASWAVSSASREKFPAWVKRHYGTVTAISTTQIDALQDPAHPRCAFGSRFPGIGRTRERVSTAVKTRTRQIANRIRLMLSGYNKDIAQGIRPRANTHNRSNEQEVVVE